MSFVIGDLAVQHLAFQAAKATVAKFTRTVGGVNESLAWHRNRVEQLQDDLAFFVDQRAAAEAKAAKCREAYGAAWLALINSGISHRTLMRILRAVNEA